MPVTPIADQPYTYTFETIVTPTVEVPLTEGDYVGSTIAILLEQYLRALQEAAQIVIDARGRRAKAEAIATLENWVKNTTLSS